MKNFSPFIQPSGCKLLQGGCRLSINFNSLSDIVSYHASRQENYAAEMKFYRRQSSFHKAIEVSAMAYDPLGKRLSHQNRLSRNTLINWTLRLQKNSGALKRCKNFHELFLKIERHGNDTRGIGELTIYDTAQRIGMYLGLEPEYIYLHAGTRDGAKALGIDYTKPYLTYDDLPKEFRKLKPREIEDCLCIYRGYFNKFG